MKFILDGEVVLDQPFFSAICGVGCDEIVFDYRDIEKIVKASASEFGKESVLDYFRSRLLCRFMSPCRDLTKEEKER